jgi:hypothetical protein
MSEGRRTAVRGQHRVLKRIRGIVVVAAGDLSEPIQLAVMAMEQLLESVSITADVRDEQLGVRSLSIGDSLEAPHKRTLISSQHPARHFFCRWPVACTNGE